MSWFFEKIDNQLFLMTGAGRIICTSTGNQLGAVKDVSITRGAAESTLVSISHVHQNEAFNLKLNKINNTNSTKLYSFENF